MGKLERLDATGAMEAWLELLPERQPWQLCDAPYMHDCP